MKKHMFVKGGGYGKETKGALGPVKFFVVDQFNPLIYGVDFLNPPPCLFNNQHAQIADC